MPLRRAFVGTSLRAIASLSLFVIAASSPACSGEEEDAPPSNWSHAFSADEIQVTSGPSVTTASGKTFSGPWKLSARTQGQPNEKSSVDLELEEPGSAPERLRLKISMKELAAPATLREIETWNSHTLLTRDGSADISLYLKDDKLSEASSTLGAVQVEELAIEHSGGGGGTLRMRVAFEDLKISMQGGTSASGSGPAESLLGGRLELSARDVGDGAGSSSGGSSSGGSSSGGTADAGTVNGDWGKGVYVQGDKPLQYQSSLLKVSGNTYTVSIRYLYGPRAPECPGCGYFLYANDGRTGASYHRYFPSTFTASYVLKDESGKVVTFDFPLTGTEKWDPVHNLPVNEVGQFIGPMYQCVDDDSRSPTRCRDLDEAKARSTSIQ